MKRGLGLVVALGALWLPETGWAFVRTHVSPSDANSPCLFWGSKKVPFRLSTRGSSRKGTDAFPAIRNALKAWTDATCSDFEFDDLGTSDSLAAGFNKALLNQPFLAGDVSPVNVIMFRSKTCSEVVPAGDDCTDSANDDCASKYDCWEFGSSVIGLTTTTYSFQTGQIFEADMELNEASFIFTTQDPPAPTCSPPPAPQVACVGIDLQNTVTHEAGHMLGLGHSADTSATMFASA